MTYEELSSLKELILYSSFTPLSQFKTETSKTINLDKVIPIDASDQRLLCKCLFRCHQIFTDFSSDLKAISPDLSLIKLKDDDDDEDDNDSENQKDDVMAIVLESTQGNMNILESQVAALIEDYEEKRLKLAKFKLPPLLAIKEVYMQLVQDLSKLDTSVSALNTHLTQNLISSFKSIKVIFVHLIENQFLEFYGCSQAVDQYEVYIQEKNEHALKKFSHRINFLLDVTLKVKKNNLLEVLFKFDDIYYDDLNRQLEKLDAFARRESDRIMLVCKSKTLLRYRAEFMKKLRKTPKEADATLFSKYEEILRWNTLANEFLSMYLDNFSKEKIVKMPFSRSDAKSKSFVYDENSLEVTWLTETSIQLIGLKTQVDAFKQQILDSSDQKS